MAEEIKREVIVEVTVSSAEAIKNIAEAKKQIDDLKAKNKELAAAEGDNSKAIAQNVEQIKALNKVVSANSKEIQTNIQRQKEQDGSLKQMRAQLKGLLDQYDSLSKTQREGAGGKEMQKQIESLTEKLRDAEAETGRFQINVGNYPGLFGQVGGSVSKLANTIQSMTGNTSNVVTGFKNAASAVAGFGRQLLKLLANPIVAIIGAIAIVVMKVVDAFKRNDDASTKLQQAFSAFQPVITALNKVFATLANTVATVIGWMTKAATAVLNLIPSFREAAKAADDLVVAQDKLEDAERDYTVNHAKNEKEIARLRDEVTDKENLSVDERRKRLQEAQDIARKDMAEAQRIAEEKLRIEIETNRQQNDLSDEAKNREAALRAELINIEKEYYQQSRTLNREMQRFNREAAAEEEALRKEREQKAKEWAVKRKEQQQKELAETRAAEDLQLAILDESIDKQKALLTTEYNRRIEDLKTRLKTETNLNKAAREAINEQIILLAAQLQIELGKVDEQASQDEYNRIKEKYQRQLELAGSNIQERLAIQMKQIEMERQQELAEAAKTGKDVALITQFYDKKINDAKIAADRETREVLKQQAQNTFDEEQNRLNQALLDMEGNELGKLQLQQQYAQQRLAVLQTEYETVMSLTQEQAIAQYGSIEAWKAAQIEADAQVIAANRNVIESSKAVTTQQQTQTMNIVKSFQETGGTIQGLFDTLASTDERYADFATGMAMANIITSSAISIASAIQAATTAGGFTGPAAVATIPAFIAELVGIVAAGITSAITTLNKAKQAKAQAKYAEGGLVSGGGTATSDSIPARLSNGEFVVNAASTRRYLPQLLAMNGGWGNTASGERFATGGVAGIDSLVRGYQTDSLRAVVEDAISNIQPVVSVKEITRVQNRVQAKELIAKS